MSKRITREVYAPMTAANDTDMWAAEVRENGIIVNFRRFNEKKYAEEWVKTASTKVSPEAARFYKRILKEAEA